MIVITSHCMHRYLQNAKERIEGKYYEFIDDIGSDVKLNFDVTNFAIKHYTVSCMIEITLKSSLGTRAIM